MWRLLRRDVSFWRRERWEDFIIPDPEDPEYTEERYIEVTERIHTIQQLVKAYWLYERMFTM